MSSIKQAEQMKLGLEALEKARKFTKKTLTRWKPDWDQAARFYRDAVKHFKLCQEGLASSSSSAVSSSSFYAASSSSSSSSSSLANARQLAIDASRESSIAHEEQGQYLQAALDLEYAASLMAKDIPSSSSSSSSSAFAACEKVYQVYQEAALNYKKNSSSDKAAAMYVKACEVMERFLEPSSDDSSSSSSPSPDEEKNAHNFALDALKEACSVFEDESRGQFHDATFKKSTTVCLKLGDYKAALEFLQRQNRLIKDQSMMGVFANDFYKNVLMMIVLKVREEEVEEAREILNQAENAGDKFAASDEADAANALIEAYEDGDSEKLTLALKKSPFKYILNPVAVIARKLKMEGSSKPKKKASSLEDDQPDADDFT